MKIVNFFAIFSALQIAIIKQGNSLTIDNQLVIIANDCYTRIAIGSILPTKDIASSVVAVTVTECEDECSRKRSTCEIFSFGISSKGNATCLLGTRVPNAEELITNSDYDIYVRQQSSPSCMPDRLYKLGSGQRNPTNYETGSKIEENDENKNKSQNETTRRPKPARRPITQSNNVAGYGISVVSNSDKPHNFAHHENPNYSGYQVSEEFPNFPSGYNNPGSSMFDVDNPNAPYTYANKNPYGITGYRDNSAAGVENSQGNFNFYIGYQQSDSMNYFQPGENQFVDDRDNHGYYPAPHYVESVGNRYGNNDYATPDAISCYRKLFTGKRLAEIHIRRSIHCEQIEDCSRECDSEKGFSCQGFNYRPSGGPRGPPSRFPSRGICELTSMQPSQIDVVRDILQEPRYDYYERETGCRHKRPPSSRPPLQSNVESGWQNLRPSLQGHGEELPYMPRPIDIPRPLVPDRRPIEIPRPLGYDYLPNRRFHGDQQPLPPPLSSSADRHWRPVHGDSYPQRIPTVINIRPIEDDVRYEYFKPGRPYLPKDRRHDIWYRPTAEHQHNDYANNDIEATYNSPPGRRKDTIHGGVYGYNTNYIDGYDHGPPLNGHRDHKRPYDDMNVYNYASAFGYGAGDNYNKDIAVHGGGQKPYEECSVRSGGGFKLRRGIVIKSYLTATLDQCENLCVVEKDCICMTFSYRYSVAANAPTDNCLLSELSYRDLDFYTDLEPDRDYDIYSITGNPQTCGKGRPANHRPPEECFWRVRSGCGVPSNVVRKAIFARGIGDCQAECVESRTFTCRSFVYRYGGVMDEGENCFLSDWPSQEIDPLSLPEVDGAELYERGSFGRGCEPSPFPPLNNRRRKPSASLDNRPPKKDEVCYAEYKKPCRLTPQAVMLTIYVNSEYECRESCSKMREREGVPCMSFSYRISNDREEDHNCYMSDVPHRDLRPGIDFVHGDGHLLFAWKEFDPECDSGYSIGIFIDNNYNEDGDYNRPKRPPGNNYLERPMIGQNSARYPPQHGRPNYDQYDHQRPYEHEGDYGGNRRPNLDGFYNRPERPLNPDRPDPIVPNYGGGPIVHGGGFYDTDGRYGHVNSDDRYNDFSYKYGASTFEHFTVNGRPCKRGTRCERNKVAGFWSCEPEGSEYGSWDYCCEPKHHCGYSQGYNYPWCYVGPYEDQWRPCSEKYYPYLPTTNRPIRPIRPSSADRYDLDDSYGEIPRPGLIGRHWPVAYLHRESPPNATRDSLSATGDVGRKNREIENVSFETATTTSLETRGNLYIVDNSRSESSQSAVSENVKKGKIERITRYGETVKDNDASSSRLIIRNSTNGVIEDHEDETDQDQLLKLRDLLNRTDDNKSSSNWADTTFVRLPTISNNKSKESAAGTFEDYFEVVNVD